MNLPPIDFYNVDLEDKATWELIQSGRTRGVFQLENRLGQDWCRKIKPNSIDELSDVISLIRPGCLQSFIEDSKVRIGVLPNTIN